MSSLNGYFKIHREDLLASWVVFIVALPLSLGIAMASGAPAGAGLITAVVGGVVAGLLAGAPLAVTGPAAGLSALVFQMIQQYGWASLAVITFLAGAIQIALGVARSGALVERVPKPVLEGMLSAIGLLILLGQLHVLAGSPVPTSLGEGLTSLPGNLANAFGTPVAVGFVAPVLFCGLLAIAIQLVWPKLHPKAALIPAALPAVVLATGVSLFFEMPRVQLSAFLPTMREQAGEFLTLGWLAQTPQLLVPAVMMAVIASAESLLSARGIDRLAAARGIPTPKASLNRELIAQGVSNSLSGMLGGLPATGVIVRSSVNLNAGARTRWSTVLHGLWIAVFVIVFPQVLERVPLTALASVLILSGWKLINFQALWKEFKAEPRSAALWVITASAIVATDLLKGLVAGLVAAMLMKGLESMNGKRRSEVRRAA